MKMAESGGRPSSPTNWSHAVAGPPTGDRPAPVPTNWSHSPGPPAVPALPTPHDHFYSTTPGRPTRANWSSATGRPSPVPVPANWSHSRGSRPATPDRSPCPPTGLLPPGDRPRPPTLTQTAKSPGRSSRPPTGLIYLGGRPSHRPCPAVGTRPPTYRLVLLTTPGSRPSQIPRLSRQLVRHRTAGRPRRPKIPPSPWPTGLQPRSPARSLAVFLPKPRPTGPSSPVPPSPPAVKR